MVKKLWGSLHSMPPTQKYRNVKCVISRPMSIYVEFAYPEAIPAESPPLPLRISKTNTSRSERFWSLTSVSYTHLTLPTKA